MVQTGDFRTKLNDHFDCDLNGENTYFVAIQMAIINDCVFRFDNLETFGRFFSAIKKLLKKVVQ